jgi:hypothetical protein
MLPPVVWTCIPQSMYLAMIIEIYCLCDSAIWHVYSENLVSTLYAECKCKIDIILHFECVTVGKTCVANNMFLCSKLCALPQSESVTRTKELCFKKQSL